MSARWIRAAAAIAATGALSLSLLPACSTILGIGALNPDGGDTDGGLNCMQTSEMICSSASNLDTDQQAQAQSSCISAAGSEVQSCPGNYTGCCSAVSAYGFPVDTCFYPGATVSGPDACAQMGGTWTPATATGSDSGTASDTGTGSDAGVSG
jgi:hypothetical protein